jgi:hypothetical protein
VVTTRPSQTGVAPSSAPRRSPYQQRFTTHLPVMHHARIPREGPLFLVEASLVPRPNGQPCHGSRLTSRDPEECYYKFAFKVQII